MKKEAKGAPKKRRRRLCDRSDGRKLRNIPPMLRFMPYIMPRRSDAQNTYADSFDATLIDEYCRARVREGMTNFSFLHVMLAAYVRAVSQRPAINRFVSGQKIFARNDISVVMVVKRSMRRDAEDTCIKAHFEPTDTIYDVYRKFNALVEANKTEAEHNSFDKLNRLLVMIPGLLCRWTVKLLNFLDYFGLLPKKILELSPFHGSLFFTSMGSLGIRPIYHHLYDFGNIPAFGAFGCKRRALEVQEDGSVVQKKYIDVKFVLDERIVDGFYYAAFFKYFKRVMQRPDQLDHPPEEVLRDID